MAKKKKKRGSAKRRMLKVLNCFLAVILTLMLGITVLLNGVLNKMNRTDGAVETMSAEEMEDYLAAERAEEDLGTMPTMNEAEVDWGDEVGEAVETEHTVDILLIGQDRRPGESRARSDSMILVSVNTETKTITITSFLRDLYVKIPGYGSNRLNASYSWGGMELLNETLEQNFGVVVDGNVEVDFDQFSQIIDLLGGVDLELRSDEAHEINMEAGGSLTKGMNHLNGVQTLSYARIRKLDSDRDFSRTARQRKVLTALVEQLKNAGAVKLMELLDGVLPMITTDMTNTEILGHAASVIPFLPEATVNSQRIPADGAYKNTAINGMSVVVADMDAARQLLKDTIGG